MAFEIPRISYSGTIKELQIGKGPQALTVGGETSYPFYLFEGDLPHPPRIAMEVYDTAPKDWAPAALEPFQEVVGDPVAWARKCAIRCGVVIPCFSNSGPPSRIASR